MNASHDHTVCTNCGEHIDASFDKLQRQPCLACGSPRRTIEVSIVEQVVVRDGYEMRVERQGQKKPFVEDRSVPSFSVDKQKVVHHARLIDRENDRYFEKVTDYESGEVIHEQEEPLSSHFGHGSAKRTPLQNGG